ncbi:DUF4479 domain-containing protein [bacterium LRH843]|nr:DUF4479 domain-containing protein [bacterium LRH843]
MNLFYNLQGIGDTLILSIKDIPQECRTFDKMGDVVRIVDSKSDETIGYNIFRASTYGNIHANGAVELTTEMKELITRAFDQNGVKDQIELEQHPAFVVGYVEAIEKHPNADKLNVCQVNVGKEMLQIVCGAQNVDQGQKVVIALTGAVMPSGLVIKETVLRGVESSGMICSAKELALPNAPEEKGILVLDETYEIGSVFTK